MKIGFYFFKGYLEVGGHLENKMKRLNDDIMREGVKIMGFIEENKYGSSINDDSASWHVSRWEFTREFQERLNRERKAEREARVRTIDPNFWY